MRVKFTIAICALLVLGLAVSQADAQGYRIASRVNDVVEGGNNQELGGLQLKYVDEGTPHIPENTEIEITFGGLTITNPSAVTFVATGGISASTAAVGNIDDDNKNQKVTITVAGTAATGDLLTLTGVRADVSGLEAGDTIRAQVSSSGQSGGFVEETTGDSGGSIRVSTVKDGLNVTAVTQISQLICDRTQTEDRMPSIKVEEGFNDAWETDAANGLDATGEGSPNNDTHIRIIVANMPSGVTFRWPGQGNFAEDGTTALATDHSDYFGPPVDMRDHDDDDTNDDLASGTLMYSSSGTQLGDDKTKHWVVYRFQGSDIDSGGANEILHAGTKNVFTVSPMVMVDTKKTGSGGVSDAWAQLYPMAKTGDDDDRATKLSYSHDPETKDKGYFVTVTECVTYLLYPFLTCGAQADWTTGISVANTTADDEAFPVNEGAAAQGGSVMIYAYPKSTTAEKMATGNMSSPEELADPITASISGNLAAGDTVAVTCNMHPMLAGFEGYAIVRAGFRAAHGMAFVLGNFMDGAAVDVAHGYIALVIPDPEYEGTRGVASGETLGH